MYELLTINKEGKEVGRAVQPYNFRHIIFGPLEVGPILF